MLSKPIVKYIQSLQHKKFRDEYLEFTAEGPKVVNELLQNSVFECRKLFALEKWTTTLDARLLGSLGHKIEIIQPFELEKIAHYTTPNQVVGIFSQKPSVEKFSLRGKCTLLLDGIQDPGNFGTIVRSADWFGIENIVCSPATADMYNSKVVQSSMASLSRVNILYTDLLQWLKKNNTVKIIAATLEGKSVDAFAGLRESILIIGNEGKGISKEIIELSSDQITIPRIGTAESLNAAVATGILLYTITRPLK